MIEAEWLVSRDAKAMLEYARYWASQRKLRLLAVACYRSIWHLLDKGTAESLSQWAGRYGRTQEELAAQINQWREHNRRSLEIAERWADGPVPPEDVRYIEERAGVPIARLAFDAWDAARAAVSDVQEYVAFHKAQPVGHGRLLHDIFGNPISPTQVQPDWRAWNGGILVQMAQVIYDERRFGDLPILADALEEAGCADKAILSHCRSGGEHARGCWVVDQLLGKE